VWNFKSSSTMGNVARVFMIFMGFYLLYQIYAKTILPLKRTIQHYEMSPQAVNSKIIDVPQEVDSILNQFDKDGKRKAIQSDSL
jgi:hypothetical protein